MKEVTIVVSPKIASEKDLFAPIAARKAGMSLSEIANMRIKRRSVDARGAKAKINLCVEILNHEDPTSINYNFKWDNVSSARAIAIIGSGPAGLFAALRAIELGYKPIVFERGRDVSSRKKDIALINRNSELNEESNYCFGEGGAGTFSDGKLFTRSKKRGNYTRSLEILHYHGANDDILFDSHPHIGTDKLPQIIKGIKNTIISAGGEFYTEKKITDIELSGNKCKAIITSNGDRIEAEAFVLATGHSAHDMYHLLHHKNVLLESKPFAMGVRIEHPQQLIDSIQYKTEERGPYLPAASYSLVTQIENRGVYSFCMCPGGFIVPASTQKGQTVVNGMSSSGRNSYFANAGIVTEVRESDFAFLNKKHGVLAGLEFQRLFEENACKHGGKNQIVPGQRVTDFIKGTVSSSLPKSSYNPGVEAGNMASWMPDFIYKSLRGGIIDFGKKMKGFATSEALLLGVESRTSSPVRIPRDNEHLNHPQYINLFPCGEGAGYAGGIISAAIDGERVVDSIHQYLQS